MPGRRRADVPHDQGVQRLATVRDEKSSFVHPGGNVIVRTSDGDLRWWTWAGFKTNATLAAALGEVIDPMQRFDDEHLRLRDDLTPAAWRALVAEAEERLCLPDIDKNALGGLKLSAALPERLAAATLAARLVNLQGAAELLAAPTRFVL